MGKFQCSKSGCNKEFISKHSTAQYCSRQCAGKANFENNHHNFNGCYSRKYTDEELIEILIEWSIKHSKTPTRREFYKDKSVPGPTTYTSRFGSWSNAIVVAGLITIKQAKIEKTKKEKISTSRNVGPKLRFQVFVRDNFTCQYCGRTPKDGYVLHADHVMPASKGGPSIIDNLVTACSECNIGKSNMIMAL